MSRFRVFKDPRAPPAWIRVPIFTQRLVGGISGQEPDDETPAHTVAFVGLQLILSPDVVVTEEHQSKIRQFLESTPRDMTSIDFMDNFDCLDGDESLRAEMVQALADGADRIGQSFGVVMAVHVHRYVRYRDDPAPSSKLVSFSDFSKQPKV